MQRAVAAAVAILHLLSVPAATPAAAQQAAPAQAETATLLPGDVVKVDIWREPDLSGEFPVDEDGGVVLPLLGRTAVVGIPMPRLRDSLLTAYREHLRNPSIGITPLRRINVLGEVNKPGTYLVDPTTSLAGVVALAGGTNQTGDLRRIRVFRGEQVILQRVAAESSLTSIGMRSGDQIFVDRRGWFDRNSTFLGGAFLSTALSIITTLIISELRSDSDGDGGGSSGTER